MLKKIFTIIFIASISMVKAQERCGTTSITKKKIEKYKEYKIARKKVENQTKNWINNNPNYSPK